MFPEHTINCFDPHNARSCRDGHGGACRKVASRIPAERRTRGDPQRIERPWKGFLLVVPPVESHVLVHLRLSEMEEDAQLTQMSQLVAQNLPLSTNRYLKDSVFLVQPYFEDRVLMRSIQVVLALTLVVEDRNQTFGGSWRFLRFRNVGAGLMAGARLVIDICDLLFALARDHPRRRLARVAEESVNCEGCRAAVAYQDLEEGTKTRCKSCRNALERTYRCQSVQCVVSAQRGKMEF